MTNEKTVPERLRELAAAANSTMRADVFEHLADRVELEYLERPILESEPLKVGDKVDGYNQTDAKVEAVMNDKMVVVRSTVKGGNGYHDEAYPLLLWCVDDLKRHVPEVLDADGVPIREGDTVYSLKTGREYTAFYHGRQLITRKGDSEAACCYEPDKLTHKQPDSLERIAEDLVLEVCKYFGNKGRSCEVCRSGESYDCDLAMRKELAQRLHALMERGQK